jgi:hypothetical protein
VPDFVATKKMQGIFAGFGQKQLENKPEFANLGD